MSDEQPNTPVPAGDKPDTPVEELTKPISLYDKTEAIVVRQEAANKKTEELLEREERLHSNQRLAGTTGGNVEVKPKDPDQEMADLLLAEDP